MPTTDGFGAALVRALARTSPAFDTPVPAPAGGFAQSLLVALRRDLPARARPTRRPPRISEEDGIWLLLETLALRDPALLRHSTAVAQLADDLAAAAGLSGDERAVVFTAGLLHDIGKQALPDHILGPGDALDPDDWWLIRRHPVDGARLLRRTDGMGEVADAVHAHHERVDGAGYPDGLVGDAIPLTARILAVAEVYDTLTAPDSYRSPLSPAEARAELLRVAGTQLDAHLVVLFLELTRPKPWGRVET